MHVKKHINFYLSKKLFLQNNSTFGYYDAYSNMHKTALLNGKQ
jgi:hypothetical protein